MHCDDLLVVSACLIFLLVERSKETLVVLYGVRVPLWHNGGEECVSNEVFAVFYRWGSSGFQWGGRAIRKETKQESREFDSTRGFPGEDIGCPYHLRH